MEKGFWDNLPRPFFCLAPMADVTDAAFRRVIAKYGKPASTRDGEPTRGGPDVMWTEFVSADGLFLGGRAALEKDLEFTDAERPIVAQFFTGKPNMMRRAAELAVQLGFDGIDINMGCPDRSVMKQGSGAALIKESELAKEIIRAAKEGARLRQGFGGQAAGLPVSVKTRIGFNKNEIETWLPALLEEAPAAITIHARTKKEMSKVSANWDVIKRAVEIRDELGSDTLIIGNGDATDLEDARKKAEESGADGVMLGRAIFGNPWLFSGKIPTTEEKLRVLVEHTKLFEELLGKTKSFSIMKKHFKAYVTGFDGAKELRVKLMETNNADEVEVEVEKFLT